MEKITLTKEEMEIVKQFVSKDNTLEDYIETIKFFIDHHKSACSIGLNDEKTLRAYALNEAIQTILASEGKEIKYIPF
ncbi:MAG: hypothetical protein PWQ10_218 [Patescibacteria group bacterium]|nr:hypothetical protein [Patescibacteria group bacterium]